MRARWAVLLSLAAVPAGIIGCGGSDGPSQAKITWVAVADWHIDVGSLHLYMDGALTRFDPNNFYGGGSGLSYSKAAVCPDKALDAKVVNALDNKPSLILTGHSNLDHSFDTATISRLTGAKVIGSLSTCFQLMGQQVANECTYVTGGEKFNLGNGVTVRVVRWNHSGNASNLDLHAPLELKAAPVPDANGCLKPGVLEDFPNGGGGRGYLFTAGSGDRRFSWYFVDTGSDYDFEQPIVIDGKDYGSPKDGLVAAMKDAGLTSVDLWIGISNLAMAQKVVPILHPKAFIPNHLGSFYTAFSAGLTAPYADTATKAYLESQGVNVQTPVQFMDAWTVDASGTVPTPNTSEKQKLGF